MTLRTFVIASTLILVTGFYSFAALAVSPAAIEQGRMLFERNWQAGNPAFGSDGLGPLFNGQSCVACHHQGGVGGGGESEFNAKTIGIEQMSISGGAVTDDVIARMVSTFHPGFVQPGNNVQNTLVITHHGGSPMYDRARKAILAQVHGQHSENGGPLDAEETRKSYSTPILFTNSVAPHKISLKARLFHRNTTSLFGAGLIDQIPDSYIVAIAKQQKKHPEISGRPATLKGGRIGKFGWRGNVASLIEFNDQACANEVGLETRRKRQARDPMMPNYRNPAHDVEDEQIQMLNAFVAALPAPVRRIPDDSEHRMQVDYGESVFANIGCAVCHVPDMGPARGVYSDILLHDMGNELIDLNHADPYRVAVTPARNVASVTTTTTKTFDTTMTGYYGGSSSMTTTSTQTSGSSGPRRGTRPSSGYTFVAPTYPEKMKIIDLGSETVDAGETIDETERTSSIQFMRGKSTQTTKTTTRKKATATIQEYVRVHYEPTRFNQEWRTPPLWGVADSAPYMHDGRAETLLEAISMHDGESSGTKDRFLQLPLADRMAVIVFLKTLVSPPNVPQAGI